MRVQKIIIKGEVTRSSWIVIDGNFVPVSSICEFLNHLENVGKSPNTVKNYAHHLVLLFTFLEIKGIKWQEIKYKELELFSGWLRRPRGIAENVIFISKPDEPSRKNSSVNVILAAVVSFLEYQVRLNNREPLDIYSQQRNFARGYKPFLHHINRGKSVIKNNLQLKTEKRHPKTITIEEFKQLISACTRTRDKLILFLMYETGMRIGQLLGLRHEDVNIYDNKISIVPRNNNVNGARAKTSEQYAVHVTTELMSLYTDYLLEEYLDIESDYVFVTLREPLGRPMNHSTIASLFKRLKRKTGINIHPHMLRHTHATEFLRAGGRIDIIRRRLGHKSVQTTINTYAHVSDEDLKIAHQEFIEKRNKKK